METAREPSIYTVHAPLKASTYCKQFENIFQKYVHVCHGLGRLRMRIVTDDI